MDAYVIVATKGRASGVRELMHWLSKQTLEPRSVVIVGVESVGVKGPKTDPHAVSNRLQVLVTRLQELCIQRNAGLDHLLASEQHRESAASLFVFLRRRFSACPGLAGTGRQPAGFLMVKQAEALGEAKGIAEMRR